MYIYLSIYLSLSLYIYIYTHVSGAALSCGLVQDHVVEHLDHDHGRYDLAGCFLFLLLM